MASYLTQTSDKKKWVAFFLCLFGGFFGLHYFYVGRYGKGVLYLFTMGLFVLGWWHDLGKILNGKFCDNIGVPLRT